MTAEEMAAKEALARKAEAEAANEERHAKVTAIADARQEAALKSDKK